MIFILTCHERDNSKHFPEHFPMKSFGKKVCIERASFSGAFSRTEVFDSICFNSHNIWSNKRKFNINTKQKPCFLTFHERGTESTGRESWEKWKKCSAFRKLRRSQSAQLHNRNAAFLSNIPLEQLNICSFSFFFAVKVETSVQLIFLISISPDHITLVNLKQPRNIFYRKSFIKKRVVKSKTQKKVKKIIINYIRAFTIDVKINQQDNKFLIVKLKINRLTRMHNW